MARPESSKGVVASYGCGSGFCRAQHNPQLTLFKIVFFDEMTEHLTAKRVVLAKIGLDGHDRGIKVVARGLRDAGFHVIYAGLWQPPEAVVQAVEDEDADWVGISLLSGAHLTLVPKIMSLLKDKGLNEVRVIIGGIIPEDDIVKLEKMGVNKVFGPGTPIQEIVDHMSTGES